MKLLNRVVAQFSVPASATTRITPESAWLSPDDPDQTMPAIELHMPDNQPIVIAGVLQNPDTPLDIRLVKEYPGQRGAQLQVFLDGAWKVPHVLS